MKRLLALAVAAFLLGATTGAVPSTTAAPSYATTVQLNAEIAARKAADAALTARVATLEAKVSEQAGLIAGLWAVQPTDAIAALTARLTALEALVEAMLTSVEPVNPPPSPTPNPSMPTPTLTPTPTPPGKVVAVGTIPVLLSMLADDTVDEIVVANGTYHVSPASNQAADSLWIGSRFAFRTRPVVVRAQTTGGVTFDGGAATYFGGLSFEGGAHDQTWQGFVFANGEPTQTGVIVFGGANGAIDKPAAHHITLRDISIAGSVTSTYAGSGDHAIYFSQAVGGPHDILVDGYTVDGSGGVNTALTFYHSTATEQNGWNVTVRNMHVTGTHQAIEVWDSTIRNLVIEDATIAGASNRAVRYEAGQVTLRRIVSTASGGFYSSLGANPPGVTFDNCSLQ